MIKARIKEIKKISERLKIFKIHSKEIEDFKFEPGQFVIFSSDAFLDENNKLVRRAYTIANAEHEKEYLEFCIAKQTYFSKFLFEEIEEGDIINIEGPFGRFKLKEIEDNITFIAGGTGIAPMISFIRTLLKKRFDKNIWLFYSVRNSEDLAYKEELEKYKQENEKFHLILTCTRECENWKGKTGRITQFLEEYIKTNRPCYICGPPAMDKAIKEKLKELGVKEENIHSEIWG